MAPAAPAPAATAPAATAPAAPAPSDAMAPAAPAAEPALPNAEPRPEGWSGSCRAGRTCSEDRARTRPIKANGPGRFPWPVSLGTLSAQSKSGGGGSPACRHQVAAFETRLLFSPCPWSLPSPYRAPRKWRTLPCRAPSRGLRCLIENARRLVRLVHSLAGCVLALGNGLVGVILRLVDRLDDVLAHLWLRSRHLWPGRLPGWRRRICAPAAPRPLRQEAASLREHTAPAEAAALPLQHQEDSVAYRCPGRLLVSLLAPVLRAPNSRRRGDGAP